MLKKQIRPTIAKLSGGSGTFFRRLIFKNKLRNYFARSTERNGRKEKGNRDAQAGFPFYNLAQRAETCWK